MKRFFTRTCTAALLAAAVVSSLAAPALAAQEPTFPDVPRNHWAYTYVEQAAQTGWISGYPDGTFGPTKDVTYSQMAVMLTSAYFKADLEAYTGAGTPWYAKFCAVADQLKLFQGMDIEGRHTDSVQVNQYLNRYNMAQMLYNTMRAAGVSTTVDLEAAENTTADWSSIPQKYRSAVAAAKAAGVINGLDSRGTFGGEGMMNRAQAATVMAAIDKVITAGAGTTEPSQPTTPPSDTSPVGTMSDTPVTLSLDTHKPIHDYWSSQDTEIRNLTDKDNFNAAVQTMRDVETILTEGKFGTTRNNWDVNLYYNYAMADLTADKSRIIVDAACKLRGYAYGNNAYMMGVRNNFYTIVKTTDSDQLAEIFAPIFARFPANATDKQKVEICMQEIMNRFDYETGTAGGFSWTNGNTKGNCESYALVTSQILSAAGIPNMQVAGVVSGGAHAWNLVYVDGSWMVVDGTAAEVGYTQPMAMGVHEQIHGYSHVLNNTDSIKVAKALVEASLS